MPWGISDGDDVNAAYLKTLVEAALGDGNPAQGASYVVFYNGDESECQARNGMNGKIDYHGTNSATVLQAVQDALTSGGLITIKGTHTIAATTTIDTSHTSVMMEPNTRLNCTATPFTVSGALHNVHFYGGRIHFNANSVDGIEFDTGSARNISVNNMIFYHGGYDGRSLYIHPDSTTNLALNDLTIDSAKKGILIDDENGSNHNINLKNIMIMSGAYDLTYALKVQNSGASTTAGIFVDGLTVQGNTGQNSDGIIIETTGAGGVAFVEFSKTFLYYMTGEAIKFVNPSGYISEIKFNQTIASIYGDNAKGFSFGGTYNDVHSIKLSDCTAQMHSTATGQIGFDFNTTNVQGNLLHAHDINAASTGLQVAVGCQATLWDVHIPAARITNNSTNSHIFSHEGMQTDFDMNDNIILDPKNHAASALSGTKKLVEIKIGGVPYYFEVSPTKA